MTPQDNRLNRKLSVQAISEWHMKFMLHGNREATAYFSKHPPQKKKQATTKQTNTTKTKPKQNQPTNQPNKNHKPNPTVFFGEPTVKQP